MTLNNKVILLTGGTGSFGNAFVKITLKKYPKIKKLIIFSRDELKQFEMNKKINHPKLRFFLGDVRDQERLNRALMNVDIVVHAAALKQVPAAEYNPIEFVKTNVIGAKNIIDAAIDRQVKKIIALSTDKAAAPINLYGATKLCSDKLFLGANRYVKNNKTIFSVVRYGNVLGSRGSVVPLFSEISKDPKAMIPITHPEMTRFSLTLEESVDMVLWSIHYTIGDEILVPKIPSYNIIDLKEAICPKNKIKFIGMRPGEKLHEELITMNDSYNTIDLGKFYSIQSESKLIKFPQLKKKLIKKAFSYNSKENKNFLNVQKLKKILKKNFLII